MAPFLKLSKMAESSIKFPNVVNTLQNPPLMAAYLQTVSSRQSLLGGGEVHEVGLEILKLDLLEGSDDGDDERAHDVLRHGPQVYTEETRVRDPE